MSVEIITDAIPRSLCLAADAAWPSPDWPFWHRYNGATANKFGSMDRARIPAACLAALDALALAVVPHIGDSFIDYDLHAAGMHMMGPGGFLGRHLDAECHPIRPWRRTHSIVMSVNADWDVERDGGQLRLESNLDSKPDILINPEIGTAVIFATAGQWHEVLPVRESQFLVTLPGMGGAEYAETRSPFRKTIALFAWDHGSCSGSTSANFGR